MSSLTSPELRPAIMTSCFLEKCALTLEPIVPFPPTINIFMCSPYADGKRGAGNDLIRIHGEKGADAVARRAHAQGGVE